MGEEYDEVIVGDEDAIKELELDEEGDAEVIDAKLEEAEELELSEIGDEVLEELVETAPQPPVIDGTASSPFPIATRFVPQSAALAK